MSNFEYEYPDGPEAFARIMAHFQNLNMDYWEARIARYEQEARAQSNNAEMPESESAPSRTNRRRKKIHAAAG